MIMAVLAKRLPIGSIPEENRIASVRNDMVNNGGGCKLAIVSTFCAERVLFEKQRTGRAPFAVITALGCVLPGIQFAMRFAVNTV